MDFDLVLEMFTVKGHISMEAMLSADKILFSTSGDVMIWMNNSRQGVYLTIILNVNQHTGFIPTV
jgi:hypothetical protein